MSCPKTTCKSLEPHVLPDNIGTEMMTVCIGVGTKRQHLSIHKLLLQKSSPYWVNSQAFESENGKRGFIYVNEDDPAAWKLFIGWLYNGQVPEPPTQYRVPSNKMSNTEELKRLEKDIWARFNDTQVKLVKLYGLAEKFGNEKLMNQTIDNIQAGYHSFGTTFGPGLNSMIFTVTKRGSKLRDLCVGANVIHMDRGCTQLRTEIMMACMANTEYFSHTMKWIASNFNSFSRRVEMGYNHLRPTEGFSMFSLSELCVCHYHVHSNPADSHGGHTEIPSAEDGSIAQEAELEGLAHRVMMTALFGDLRPGN